MLKNSNRSLWQIFFSYLLVTLVSIAVITWCFLEILDRFYIEEVKTNLKERVSFLKDRLNVYLNPVDLEKIDKICKKAGKSSHTRFTVILPSGKVVGDSIAFPQEMDNHGDRPEIVQAMKYGEGESIRHSYTLHQDMIYVARAIEQGPKVIGVVRAAFSLKDIERDLFFVRRKVLIVALSTSLLTIFVSFVLSRRIVRPVEEINEGLIRIASGDLEYRFPSEGLMTLAPLSASLNSMVQELRRQLEEVKEKQSELETILASMTEGVLTFDREEKLVSINEAALKMFNLDREWAIGRTLQEIIRNSSIQRMTAQALNTQKNFEDEIVIYDFGLPEPERHMSVHISLWRGPQEDVRGVLLVLNDVTHLRRLENMRREFISNASHEMKTPVTAIKASVETLSGGHVTKQEDVKKFLRIIEKHAIRLENIIRDLLDLSMIEQEVEKGGMELASQPLSLVLESAVSALSVKAEEKGIKIEVSCPDTVTVMADFYLLEQAIINLLDNAINYSHENSTVFIKGEKTGKEVVVNVIDHGIGIKKHHLSRIFERFYRVDKGRSRDAGGTGLGLAIVKHICRAHGGRVTVQSTYGEGSCFSIHIPIIY